MPYVPVEIKEDMYKPDVEIANRFDAISSESLRISLLAICAIGFLLADVSPSISGAEWCLGWAIVSLAIGVGSSLGHRYCSTYCVLHRVRQIKAGVKKDDSAAQSAAQKFRVYRKACGICMFGAVAGLATGVFFVALTFAVKLLAES